MGEITNMKIIYCYFLVGAVLFSSFPAATEAADWIHQERSEDVIYFFSSQPAVVERYDTQLREWLPALELPAARGALTAGTADADGLYIAYDKSIYRYSLVGSGERYLMSSNHTVRQLFTDGDLLLANISSSLYARFLSISKVTNTFIDDYERYVHSLYGGSIARSINRLFGVSSGVSPADVNYLEYADDGSFVGGHDSPHHGAYLIGSRTWTFPDGARFVDSTGHVYSSSSLQHLNSFASPITDLAFWGGDVSVILAGNTLTIYSNAILPEATVTLAAAGKSLFIDDDEILVFRPTAEAGIALEVIAIDSLEPPTPGLPVNPVDLPYTPDALFADGAGIVYLFSKAHQSVFRWDSATQEYLETIPLLGVPEFVALSPENRKLYTLYESGLIRELALDTAEWVETPFATLPSKPRALAMAGSYVFAVDNTSPWRTHYTFAPDGSLVSSRDWNHFSADFVWSEANQKMYFLRDSSPTDLMWEEINSDGVTYPSLPQGGIGMKKDSPLHTSAGFSHPIRVKADGSRVLMGTGVIHMGISLERLPAGLPNGFTDAVWVGDNILSVREAHAVTQFQEWIGPDFVPGAVLQVPGKPMRMTAPLPGGRVLALTKGESGIPSFYVFEAQFDIVAPEVLAVPQGLRATLLSADAVPLEWRDLSGEAGYLVERRADSGGGWSSWSEIGTTGISETLFVDTDLQLGLVYEYRVFAVNGANTSDYGEIASLVFDVPETVTGLNAVALSGTSVSLNWEHSRRATAYDIYQKSPADENWTLVSSTLTMPLATVTSLQADQSYQFMIRATNGLGESMDSESVLVTTPMVAPVAPSLSRPVAASPSSVALQWSGHYLAETYLLERRGGPSEDWQVVAEIDAPANQYFDTGLQYLTTYTYRLFARNSAGSSPASNSASVTTPDLPLPGPLQGFTATAESEKSNFLAWNDVSNEAGYRVERSVGEDPWTVIADLPSDTIDHRDETVEAGTYYNYRVVAYNERGETFSQVINVQATYVGVILEETFDPINYPNWQDLSGGQVQAGLLGFYSGNALWMGQNGTRRAGLRALDLTEGGQIAFMFRAGNSDQDGTLFWDNSEAGESVVFEFSTDGINWSLLTFLNTEFPSHSAWMQYEILLPQAARSASTRFRWRQLAHSGAGFDTWALDNIRVLGAIPEVPGQVPFIMGSANSSRQVALSWIESSEATYYHVQRREPQTTWDTIGQVPAGEAFFTDDTASPATIYSYRVVAANVGGEADPSDAILIQTWSVIAEWRFQNYGTLADSGIAADLEDNGTGVANLIRFAFNMAKDTPAHKLVEGEDKGLPFMRIEGDQLHIAFLRRRDREAAGLEYIPEFSSNLRDWTQGGVEVLTESVNLDFEFVVMRAPEEEESGNSRFARLRVQRVD